MSIRLRRRGAAVAASRARAAFRRANAGADVQGGSFPGLVRCGRWLAAWFVWTHERADVRVVCGRAARLA
jgi:hypothetical protein